MRLLTRPYRRVERLIIISLKASTIYSLCRQGCHSSTTAGNLAGELSTSHGLQISISQTGVAGYWQTLGKTYSMESIQHMMGWLLPKFQASIRLKNLVLFAQQRGLTLYYLVKRALGSFPDFDWEMVYSSAQNDFENYRKARELVQDRPYYGYNPDIGIAAATNYPTLAFVSLTIHLTHSPHIILV